MTTLRQSRLLRKREFELQKDGVEVKEQFLLSSRRFKVPYVTIPNETFEVTVYSKIAFWMTTGFVVVAILWFILTLTSPQVDKNGPYVYLAGAALFGLRLLATYKSFIGYRCGDLSLLFYRDKPSRSELEQFLRSIQQAKIEYIQQRTALRSSQTLADELQKLVWLRDHGDISHQEFDQLKSNLLSKQPGTDDSPHQIN